MRHGRYRLGAAMHVEFLEDVVDVVLHRGCADAKLASDLLVGSALHQVTAHLELSARKRRSDRLRSV